MEFALKTLVVALLAVVILAILIILITGWGAETGTLLGQIFDFFRGLIPT